MKRTILIGTLAALAAAGCGPTRETAREAPPAEPALVGGESVRWAVQWARMCSEDGECVLIDAEKLVAGIAARAPELGKLPEPMWATLDECRSGARAQVSAEGIRLDDVGCKPVRVADAGGHGWVAGQTTMVMDFKIPAGEACPEAAKGLRMEMPDTGAAPGTKAFVECPREKPGWVRMVTTSDLGASGAPLPRYETRRDCLRAARASQRVSQDPKAMAGVFAALGGAVAPLGGAENRDDIERMFANFERMIAKGAMAFELDVVCSPTPAPEEAAGPDRDGS